MRKIFKRDEDHPLIVSDFAKLVIAVAAIALMVIGCWKFCDTVEAWDRTMMGIDDYTVEETM